MATVISASIFKANDIRGKYPDEINEEVVSKIVEGLTKFFGSGKIVIAHDARLSSPSLYRATIRSIKCQASSVKIIKVGMATTPMFYFLVKKLKADGGIMITASHNPKEYNGLKIVGKNAIPISGRQILKILNPKS